MKVTIKDLPYAIVDFDAAIDGALGSELRLKSPQGYLSEAILPNTKTLVKLPPAEYDSELNLPPQTTAKIKKLVVTQTSEYSISRPTDFRGRVLLLTPSYPSANIPQLAPFIHAKVKEYKKRGLAVDVAVVNYEEKLYRYHFDGVDVVKISYAELFDLLSTPQYESVLIHFFDVNLGRTLLAPSLDLSNKKLFIYSHGAEVDLYSPDIYGPYSLNGASKTKTVKFTPEELKIKQEKFEILSAFEKLPNVTWIFNTKWNYENAKKVTGLKFKKHQITPCIVDENVYKFSEKFADDRYNILIFKKMDNFRSYAVDLAVEIVEKLSKKPYFDKLNITVLGDGAKHSELTKPLKKYKNVEIVKKFTTPAETANYFEQNGILLAPSRYDTQGLAVGEAAMSGLVVVASTGTGVSSMLPESLGTFFDNDRLSDAVKIFDRLMKNPDEFLKLSEKFHSASARSASPAATTSDLSLIAPKTRKPTTVQHEKRPLALLRVAFDYERQGIKYAPVASLDFRSIFINHFTLASKTLAELTPLVAENLRDPNFADFLDLYKSVFFHAYSVALEYYDSYPKFARLEKIFRPHPELYALCLPTLSPELQANVKSLRKYRAPYYYLRKAKARTLSIFR